MSRQSREACFAPDFLEDLRNWVEMDRKLALRTLDLVAAVMKDPFGGIGKPEHQGRLAPEVWSRRLTQRDRLVYRVLDERVDFLQCRYHYS